MMENTKQESKSGAVKQRTYWINALYVAIGEFAVLILGAIVFLSIGKIPTVRKARYWHF